MIELKCPLSETVWNARINLVDFLDYMGYTYKGYIKELPEWRSHDYKYYLELGLTDVEDFDRIIQGAFDEEDCYAPVRQIKRYLLIGTHI